MEGKHRCLNCGTEFEGNYCPQCGQSAKTRRMTVSSLFQSLATAMFSFDKGFWKTLRGLFTRPGRMMGEYLRGRRASYGNPFSLLVILTTIFIVEAHFLGVKNDGGFIRFNVAQDQADSLLSDVDSLVQSRDSVSLADLLTASNGDDSEFTKKLRTKFAKLDTFLNESRLIKEVKDWVTDNKLFYTLTAIPLYALAMYWVFRKRRKQNLVGAQKKRVYNYAECLCVFTFYACQVLIISILTMPIQNNAKMNGFSDMGLLTTLALLTWDFTGLFHMKVKQALWQSIKVIIVHTILLVLLCILVLIAAGLLSILL